MAQTIKILLLIILFLFFYERGIKPAWISLNSDFPIYYTSAKLLYEGQNMDSLYNKEWFQQEIKTLGIQYRGRFSPFPPANAFIMLPVASFEPLTAKRIWTIINGFALIWALFLLKRLTGWTFIDCSLFILLTGMAVGNNFKYGKVYLILCCLVMYSHILITKGKYLIPGLLLGFCASLKYFPIIFILGYSLNRKWKVSFCSAISILLMILIQIMAMNWSVFHDYLTTSLFPHLFGKIEDVSPYAVAFQSWESFFRNVFVYHKELNPNPIVKWEYGKPLFQFLIIFSFVVVISWQLRRIFKYDRQNFQAFVIALPAFFSLTMLPVGATYHFLFLIFPLALYLSAVSGTLKKIQIGILVFIYTSIGFIPFGFAFSAGTSGFGILLSYPRLWLMSALLICSLVFVNTHLRLKLQTRPQFV